MEQPILSSAIWALPGEGGLGIYAEAEMFSYDLIDPGYLKEFAGPKIKLGQCNERYMF